MVHLTQYNEVEIRIFLYCTVTQQSSKFLFLRLKHCSDEYCTSEENWKQVIRFFIEYGTVVRLEERTEQYMPAV